MRTLVSVAVLAVVASYAAFASASPTFPAAIADHLSLGCEPDCTTCHTRATGGLGTARQPFGEAMQRAGLAAGQPGRIAAALDELAAEASDVDDDGVTDIDELEALTNPNTEGESLRCLDGSSGDDGGGGCSVNRAAPRNVGAILAIGVGLFFARWRRNLATNRRGWCEGRDSGTLR